MMRILLRSMLFVLPVLIFLPHLDQFAFQPGSSYSDMLISHYPNGLFLKMSLQQGIVPLWSPTILGGYPFVANPLSGLGYLPGWLALVMPFPLGFNLVLILHLIFGGIGMYLFLRSEGLVESTALLGALVFEAMPKIYSHFGAGHLTLLYAVAWTPWLLYSENRASSSGRYGWVLPGIIIGSLALADVRWAAYAGLLWLAFTARGYFRTLPGQRNFLMWLGVRVRNLAVAGFIASPLLLPLLQYTLLATRSQMTIKDGMVLSLPPAQFLGLVYPNIGGPAEWQLYSGAVTLVLSLYALLNAAVRRKAAFWLGLVLVSLIFAMGDAVPLMNLVARLPGFSLLRVPPRALLISGFGLSILAAYAFQDLLAKKEDRFGKPRDKMGLIFFGAAAFVGLFGLAVWLVVDSGLARIQFAWGAVFFISSIILIGLARRRRLHENKIRVLVFVLCLVDLLGVNGLSLTFRSSENALAEGQAAAAFLTNKGSPGSFRVYSPSYSIPQQTAAVYGLELADGIDPLQLRNYVDFMNQASGVPFTGYSVTLPPFASAQPAIDNRNYLPDLNLLGLLNVGYVAAEFPIHDDRLNFLAQFDNTRIYQNTVSLPRAWIQPVDAPLGESVRPVTDVKKTPNKIILKTDGPGLLILSEIDYPGWQVKIDGRPGQVERVGGLLRGVKLNNGEHLVEFAFHPVLFYLGLVLASLVWLIMISMMFTNFRKRSLYDASITKSRAAV